VTQKSSELEAAKAKLRLLGQDLIAGDQAAGSRGEHHEDAAAARLSGSTAAKAAENRVHFDLRSTRAAPAPARDRFYETPFRPKTFRIN
jgi:hypothetical protein